MYLKLVRLVRLVRFFTQGAYSTVLQVRKDIKYASYSSSEITQIQKVTANALLNSKEALVMLVVYIWIVLFISATAVFFTERGTYDTSKSRWVSVSDNSKLRYVLGCDYAWEQSMKRHN
jgi:beta-lactamase regulating signal transducer with metallopeptidase domain